MQATTWIDGSQGTEISSQGSIQGTAAAIRNTGTEQKETTIERNLFVCTCMRQDIDCFVVEVGEAEKR